MQPEKRQQERRTATGDSLGDESVIRDNQSAGERINVSFSWFVDIFDSLAVLDTSRISLMVSIIMLKCAYLKDTTLKMTNVLVNLT